MTHPDRSAPDLTRRLLAAATSLAALGLLAGPARAQAPAATPSVKWPERPVRLIVAGPPGGSADIVARLLADKLAPAIGQPLIVEPRPGAAGAIAVNDLSQAAADGHTLLVGVNSLVSEIPHIVKLRFDMAQAIRPVAELARGSLVLVGTPAFPANTLAELVAYVKAHPGQVSYASYSAGTMSHVLGLLLNQAAGLDMVHVGYKGSTPALTDVMGGHVPLMFDALPTSLPLIKGGRIKAFATSASRRSALLPGVPTFHELGFPQLDATAWMGLWIRPDTPPALQALVRDAALKAMAQPGVRERLQETGFEPGDPRGVEDMRHGLAADSQRVGATLKAIDFKPE